MIRPAFLLIQSDPAAGILSRITVWNVLLIAIALSVAFVLIRGLNRVFVAISSHNARARFLILYLEPVTRIAIWLLAMLFAVQLLAPNEQTFVAALGSVAIAIGLGAQDLIKNLVGGLVILIDRPYQLGDRIRVGSAYGDVDHIGMRSTKITTVDYERVTIPNSQVLSDIFINSNDGTPEAGVVAALFVPGDADPDAVLAAGREAAFSSPYMVVGRPVSVVLEDAYTESPYMILRVKAFVYDHRYEIDMRTDIIRRCKVEFGRRGILELWNKGGG
ncbi:MAG: mechanosensitive ion channel [Acidobacteria bacterium]|nr:mechanosensitive ion channel [Acidobacteriota bacterium]